MKKQVLSKSKTYLIDATGKPLGRLASKIAQLLMGKENPNFLPFRDSQNIVKVKNVKKLRISGKKLEKKIYYHHSGYPGGLKKEKLATLFKKKPELVLKRAVYGMLPKNKLRAKRIKRLIFLNSKEEKR